ncbi:hypothetical protein FACS189461_3500 [Spirochaetia bacterium]|nr:hypothetical protein FACS189461_3500 [Spirochaetia bacterium]
MIEENIRTILSTYSKDIDFIKWILPLYHTIIIDYIIETTDVLEKIRIFEDINTNIDPLGYYENLINNCEILYNRKHSKKFVLLFMKCYRHNNPDMGIVLGDVYSLYDSLRENKLSYKEALNDIKTDNVCEAAAKVYAELVQYGDNENYCRNKAQIYDLAYKKAVNQKKTPEYAEHYAERMVQIEGYEPPDSSLDQEASLYADTYEKIKAMGILKNQREIDDFVSILDKKEFFLGLNSIDHFDDTDYFDFDWAIAEVIAKRYVGKIKSWETLQNVLINTFYGLMEPVEATVDDDITRKNLHLTIYSKNFPPFWPP